MTHQAFMNMGQKRDYKILVGALNNALKVYIFPQIQSIHHEALLHANLPLLPKSAQNL